MKLFTYGSLMMPEVLREVAGGELRGEPATLEGYARYRMLGKPYPGIVAERDATTSGVLYDGLDATAIARLDAFEGAWYRRVTVSATTRDGVTTLCEVYVVAEAFHDRVTRESWSLDGHRDAVRREFLGA